jgi:hypothetical protein
LAALAGGPVLANFLDAAVQLLRGGLFFEFHLLTLPFVNKWKPHGGRLQVITLAEAVKFARRSLLAASADWVYWLASTGEAWRTRKANRAPNGLTPIFAQIDTFYCSRLGRVASSGAGSRPK